MGNYESALEYNQEALSIAKEKITLLETRALISQGHILRELGDLDQAVNFYQQTLHLVNQTSLPECYRKQAQTGLANIALVRGDLVQVEMLLNEILNYLDTHSLATIDEMVWMYLTCYQILQATADPRAHTILDVAYATLQDIARQIDDKTLRASFLQNVRDNRDMITAREN